MEPQRSFTVCTQFCISHSDGELLKDINEKTTVQEFDKLLARHPKYKIEYCGLSVYTHALSRAAAIGNTNLVYHIVKNLNGQHLLNLGSGRDEGWTPLYFAGNCSNPKRGYKASKMLLALGADPNIASTPLSLSSSFFPGHSTPLYIAAEKTKNLPLVKLLLLHGAVVHPALSRAGEAVLARAKLELVEKSKRLKALLEYSE
jgi:hypothetical protein